MPFYELEYTVENLKEFLKEKNDAERKSQGGQEGQQGSPRMPNMPKMPKMPSMPRMKM